MTPFSTFGLKKEILPVLTSKKITEPTEIQAAVIPKTTTGKNVVFTSQTGSGKTLAYSLGALGRINKKLGIQLLILVPTRELAVQVSKELKPYAEELGFSLGTLYGGRDVVGDLKTTRKKNHIIVGTPGRVIQHINEKTIKVGEVHTLVFDESDQMFDQGFYDDCQYVRTRVSKNAQLILASATISNKVQRFMAKEMGKYELIQLNTAIPEGITQEKISCSIKEKQSIVLTILEKETFRRGIIFCNTKARTNDVADSIKKNTKIGVRSLNSNLDQTKRQNILNLFKERKLQIIVATDVAARGLHIEEVDLIINYDVPNREEFYVHRIGRTGRKKTTGKAINLVCPEDEERMEEIEKKYKLDITSVTP